MPSWGGHLGTGKVIYSTSDLKIDRSETIVFQKVVSPKLQKNNLTCGGI